MHCQRLLQMLNIYINANVSVGCIDKFTEEKHIQSYYKDTSFVSGASCVTDCGALEEYSGKLWWWLLWLLTISQASAMSLLETGRRAIWDLSVTQYICCFASSPHGNGFECSCPGLHRDVQRAMNELLAALCPRAGVRGGRRGGGWQQQNLLSFVVDDMPGALFDLCRCAVVHTTSNCHYSGFLYSA